MFHSNISEYDDPASQTFSFPIIYHFPPFFTRQLNERTWYAQLVNWSALILSYCRFHRIYTLDLSRTSSSIEPQLISITKRPRGEIDGELFRNSQINRALQPDAIKAVFEYMVTRSDAVWLDQPNTTSSSANSADSETHQDINDFDDLDQDSQFERYEQVFRSFSAILSNNNSSTVEPSSRSCILVYWRHPQEWASLITEWV